jgi:hypothetical protein
MGSRRRQLTVRPFQQSIAGRPTIRQAPPRSLTNGRMPPELCCAGSDTPPSLRSAPSRGPRPLEPASRR